MIIMSDRFKGISRQETASDRPLQDGHLKSKEIKLLEWATKGSILDAFTVPERGNKWNPRHKDIRKGNFWPWVQNIPLKKTYNMLMNEAMEVVSQYFMKREWLIVSRNEIHDLLSTEQKKRIDLFILFWRINAKLGKREELFRIRSMWKTKVQQWNYVYCESKEFIKIQQRFMDSLWKEL